jgi:hypothetical protein
VVEAAGIERGAIAGKTWKSRGSSLVGPQDREDGAPQKRAISEGLDDSWTLQEGADLVALAEGIRLLRSLDATLELATAEDPTTGS